MLAQLKRNKTSTTLAKRDEFRLVGFTRAEDLLTASALLSALLTSTQPISLMADRSFLAFMGRVDRSQVRIQEDAIIAEEFADYDYPVVKLNPIRKYAVQVTINDKGKGKVIPQSPGDLT